MTTFFEGMEAAETALEKGLLTTAVTSLERALQIASNDHERAFASYQLGALFWGEVGDGQAARSCFVRTVTHRKGAVGAQHGGLRQNVSLLANAAENLMILSLSSEEFDRWTDELRREAPQEAILHETRPIVLEMRDRGESWPDVMLRLAMTYIRPGEVGGGSHPASGACIFQLLIHHRKQFRLSRQAWHTAVLGYVAAMNDVLSHIDALILKSTGCRQPNEFAFALRLLTSTLNEYCAENPSDLPVAKIRDEVERELREIAAITAAQGARVIRPNQEATSLDHLPPPEHGALAGTLAIFALGLWPFLSAAAVGWRIVGGFAISLGGLGLLYLLRAQSKRHVSWAGDPWRRNAMVEKELRKRGLVGLSFRLNSYEIGEGAYLYLNFRALNAVPEDKARFAHLALRSIVALTLPQVVGRLPGHQLLDAGASYTIVFGDGVSVPFYDLKGPSGTWSTLQLGSEVDGDACQVYIHPSFHRLDLIDVASFAEIGPEHVIQKQVGQAFMDQFGDRVLTL